MSSFRCIIMHATDRSFPFPSHAVPSSICFSTYTFPFPFHHLSLTHTHTHTHTHSSQRCFLWSYDPEQDRCSTMPMSDLPLLFGRTVGTNVDAEYIYQPGFPLMTYHDNFLCIWNVSTPADPCIFAEYTTLFKDFHTSDSSPAACENLDHVHIRYETHRNRLHCGNQNVNNCPSSNCITRRIISGEFDRP